MIRPASEADHPPSARSGAPRALAVPRVAPRARLRPRPSASASPPSPLPARSDRVVISIEARPLTPPPTPKVGVIPDRARSARREARRLFRVRDDVALGIAVVVVAVAARAVQAKRRAFDAVIERAARGRILGRVMKLDQRRGQLAAVALPPRQRDRQ